MGVSGFILGVKIAAAILYFIIGIAMIIDYSIDPFKGMWRDILFRWALLIFWLPIVIVTLVGMGAAKLYEVLLGDAIRRNRKSVK